MECGRNLRSEVLCLKRGVDTCISHPGTVRKGLIGKFLNFRGLWLEQGSEAFG